MEELRVPTTPIEAELELVDGRVLHGTVFVPASTSIHSGFKRPDEWINEPAEFFPFLLKGAEGAELFGKASAMRLSVPAPVAHDEDMPADVERRRVVVECPGSRFEGEVYLDMPVHQRRVLDYLNQAERFITVHDGERVHLIQKRIVIRVLEPT